MRALLTGLALACFVGPALASDRCISISIPQGAVAEHHGSWTILSDNEWQFLRGVYALNPQTPPGLPFGDHAALATMPGEKGGLVFFIDGDRACTPMAAPGELLEMLETIKAKTISHEDDGT